MALAPWDDHWKGMRRLTQQALNKTTVQQYKAGQARDARVLLHALLDNPGQYMAGVRLYESALSDALSVLINQINSVLGKNIMEMTYGIEVESPSNQVSRYLQDS